MKREIDMKEITYEEMFELINKVEAFNKPITIWLTQDAFDSHNWKDLLKYNIEYRIIPNEFDCDGNIIYIIPQDKTLKLSYSNNMTVKDISEEKVGIFEFY